MDRYLKKQAKQDMKRRISRVFVATTPDNPKAVIGYCTLSTLSIELKQLPEFCVQIILREVRGAVIAIDLKR